MLKLINGIKRAIAALALMALLATSATPAQAEEVLDETLKGAVYGGIIGALMGSALVLLSENPDDNINYIAKGAGAGILLGAAYGVTASTMLSLGEVEGNKFSLNVPSINTAEVFDKNANQKEIISVLDLLRFKF